jgi:hypothetical protein
MGSFNTTCAISKAPILEGQKVRVFFLAMDTFSLHYDKEKKDQFSNIYMGLNCYPWDNFKIIGYPLLGEYKDYNQYEFDDEEMSELTLKVINKVYAPNKISKDKKESDYNSCHDYLNIEELEDMHQLQEMEHSGSLRIKTCHGISAIAKMAIHEEVYQNIIKKGKTFGVEGFNDRKGYNFEEHVEFLVNKIKQSKEGTTEKSKENMEVLKECRDHFESQIGKVVEGEEPMTQEKVEEKIISLERMLSRINQEQVLKIEGESWLSETNPSRDVEKNDFYEKIVEAWVCSIWVKNWFHHNNCQFAPVPTSGQDYDFQYSGDKLMEMANVISNFKSRWDEEENLTFQTEYIKKVSLNINEMEEKFKLWFSETDEEYKDFKFIIKKIKEDKVESFTMGDFSVTDVFMKENELLQNIEEGTEIHLIY